MYQVIKDNITFYVDDEEKALQYAEEGYDIFLVTKLKIGENNKLQEEEPINSVTGIGISETVTKPPRM